MRLKNWILSSALISTIGMNAMAADTPPKVKSSLPQPVVQQKHFLPNAIRIQITDRGMKYFDTNLGNVLSNLGISFDEGFFPGTTWQSDRSYRIDDIDMPPEQKKMLTMVANFLNQWVSNFSIQELRPTIQIGNTGYTAQFTRFALVTDNKLLAALGKSDGAVLAVELEIKNLTVATSGLHIKDNASLSFIKPVGADNISLRMATGDVPLKIRLPFYMRINPTTGQPEIQAVQITNNIDQTDLAYTYQNLLVPHIVLDIDDHHSELNPKVFDQLLTNNKDAITSKLKNFLGDFATKQLPQMLNDEIKKAMTGPLEEVNRMSPVGAADNSFDAKNPFLWGLKVGAINMRGNLQLGLDAYVEDPLRPKTSTMPALGARGLPNVNVVSADSYDIALAIDRGFINRILQLSFNRGLFSNIQMDGGIVAKLTQIPAMDYVDPRTVPNYGTVPGEKSTLLRMKTKIMIPPGMLDFWQRQAIDEPFEVSLDVIGKMIQMPSGDLKILYWDIDPASVGIDDQYLTLLGRMMHGKVQSGLQDKMASIAKGWRESGKVLANSFPIPQEILGIKLETQRVIFDPKGYILLYMNYAPSKLMTQTKSTNGGAQ